MVAEVPEQTNVEGRNPISKPKAATWKVLSSILHRQ
jgi:hypothetical protein